MVKSIQLNITDKVGVNNSPILLNLLAVSWLASALGVVYFSSGLVLNIFLIVSLALVLYSMYSVVYNLVIAKKEGVVILGAKETTIQTKDRELTISNNCICALCLNVYHDEKVNAYKSLEWGNYIKINIQNRIETFCLEQVSIDDLNTLSSFKSIKIRTNPHSLRMPTGKLIGEIAANLYLFIR